LRDAPVTSILKFLDSIESSSELMFVTKIEIARRFNKMTNARANISVSTYKFAGKEEAEKAATMEE
ncbi:MAG: hypothetical protein FJ088_09935, partial [Deltaproteobacteria bacterium]|nr:hypothetical protein [Deltaproteobacteria bacterium]